MIPRGFTGMIAALLLLPSLSFVPVLTPDKDEAIVSKNNTAEVVYTAKATLNNRVALFVRKLRLEQELLKSQANEAQGLQSLMDMKAALEQEKDAIIESQINARLLELAESMSERTQTEAAAASLCAYCGKPESTRTMCSDNHDGLENNLIQCTRDVLCNHCGAWVGYAVILD